MGSPCRVDFVSGLDRNEDSCAPSLAVTSRPVAVFGPLPVSAWPPSFLGWPVSILGLIPVSPEPLSAWLVTFFGPLPVVSSACAFPCSSGGRGDRLRSHDPSHVARAVTWSAPFLLCPLAVWVDRPSVPGFEGFFRSSILRCFAMGSPCGSWCYRASWLAQGWLPVLRPFALLLASCGGVPSGSLLRVPRQVFVMGSPFPVEPVSILDRNVDFLHLSGFGWSLRDGVTLSGRFCLRSRSERRLLRTFPCGHVASGRGFRTATGLGLAALVLGVTSLDPRIDTGLAGTALGVTGHVLRTAPCCVVSVRIPLLVGRSGWPVAVSRSLPRRASGHVVGALPSLPACVLSRQAERSGIRRLLPFIYPSLLRDGVTLRVVCVFSHSIVTMFSFG